MLRLRRVPLYDYAVQGGFDRRAKVIPHAATYAGTREIRTDAQPRSRRGTRRRAGLPAEQRDGQRRPRLGVVARDDGQAALGGDRLEAQE